MLHALRRGDAGRGNLWSHGARVRTLRCVQLEKAHMDRAGGGCVLRTRTNVQMWGRLKWVMR
eukprot:2954530-Prorocentrum_lima.AAC.1